MKLVWLDVPTTGPPDQAAPETLPTVSTTEHSTPPCRIPYGCCSCGVISKLAVTPSWVTSSSAQADERRRRR